MKHFTAKQFNTKRQEIRDALENQGKCLIQWKSCDRKIEMQAVIIHMEALESLGINLYG